ncbi:hypothetical protein R6Q59_023956 [Mikania micrantha]
MARERWISGGQKAWLCKRMNCFLKYEVNCKIDLTNCKEGTAVEGDGGGGRRRWDDGGGGAAMVVPAVEQLAGGGELEMGLEEAIKDNGLGFKDILKFKYLEISTFKITC